MPGSTFFSASRFSSGWTALSGVRSEAPVRCGGRFETLRKTAEQIQAIMAGIAGVKDVRVEQLFGQAYLTIDIDRGKIARYGINVAHIREIISTAIGAQAATRVYEGQKRFDLILRYPQTYRNSWKRGNILMTTLRRSHSLGKWRSRIAGGPADSGKACSAYLLGSIRWSDIGASARGSEEDRQQVRFHRLSYRWGGAFENMQRPWRVDLIGLSRRSDLLLCSPFNSVRPGLIISNPAAMIAHRPSGVRANDLSVPPPWGSSICSVSPC